MQIILFIPNIGKYVGANDEFVEEKSAAKIFDSILAADSHSAYLEHVYGITCFTGVR